MAQNFIKHQENFTCDQCGTPVVGNGYTNHCPHCLWSKHVDIDPGDRAAGCGGPMEPINLAPEGGALVVTHRCQVCHHQKRNKTAPEDDVSGYLEGMI